MERRGFMIPTEVSADADGKRIDPQGTQAFVPIGTELKKGLNPRDRFLELRRLAQGAQFFTKPNPKKQRLIASKLMAAGIQIETPIQALGRGRALSQWQGHSILTQEGKMLFNRHFWNNVMKVEEIVAKMHSLGITHNHLHGGNITIDEHGVIRIIDLSKADIHDFQKRGKNTKPWALKYFFSDLGSVSGTLMAINPMAIDERFRDRVFGNIVTGYSDKLRGKIPSEEFYLLIEGYSKAKKQLDG